MSPIVVVLGMHRSGTSYAAHLLHRAGMYLGGDVMTESEGGNLDGHWESREALRINEDILRRSDGAWDRVPAALRGDEDIPLRMARFLAGLAARPVAGWKEPRTTITFPLWKPHLAAYHVVACFRHPVSVARSLAVREGWPPERGLALWADYNERLLEHAAAAPAVTWLDFDAVADDPAPRVEALCRRLGLRFDRAVLETFNPFLRHHKEKEPIPDARARALYEELGRRAEAERARAVIVPAAIPSSDPERDPAAEPSGQPASAALSPGLPMRDALAVAVGVLRDLLASMTEEGLPHASGLVGQVDRLSRACHESGARLGQLAHVLQLQNALQQEHVRALAELRGRQEGLESGLQPLPLIEQRVVGLEQALADRVAALEQRLEGRAGELLREMEGRVGALGRDLGERVDRVDRLLGEQAGTLHERVGAHEGRTGALEERIGSLERALDERVAGVGQMLEQHAAAQAQALEGRAAGLERAHAGLEQAIDERLAGLGRQTEARVGDLDRRLEEAAGELGRRIEQGVAALGHALEREVSGLRGELERHAAGVGGRLEEQAARSDALAAQVGTLAEDAKRSRALVAQLRQAAAQAEYEVAALHGRQRELEAVTTDCQRFIARLRRALPVRLCRALLPWKLSRFFRRPGAPAAEREPVGRG